MDVKLESFKRNEYDRGTKKIVVDGEQWGWIEMTSHGVHGPKYHLKDMHGEVNKPNKTSLGGGRSNGVVPVTFRPENKRHFFISNIGKPEHEQRKPIKTEVGLADLVRTAIAVGWMRSPAARNKEIADKQKRYAEHVRRTHEADELKFAAKAQDIIFMITDGKSNDAVKTAIIDAMKWAQTQ